MEVKIGVQHSPRELTVDSSQSPADVEQAVADAIAAESGVLTLTDEKGRKLIIPAARIAYVEIAEADSRRVGFVVG
ncbi:MAG: DUF3107 domain-containing protein [Geodermatophilaceae bacterium]|nr:DUF3107 domain-containing protein [Geodermatophilaceae bacterium]MDQ3465647.1 DUF3107 domain-containing protein [Actinomycetota bacterium]